MSSLIHKQRAIVAGKSFHYFNRLVPSASHRALATPAICSSRSNGLHCLTFPSKKLILRQQAQLSGPIARRHRSACAHHEESHKSRIKTAYVALGSNLGDRVAEIERACNEMDRRGIRVRRTSSLYETEPMYVADQARFLNGACEVS